MALFTSILLLFRMSVLFSLRFVQLNVYLLTYCCSLLWLKHSWSCYIYWRLRLYHICCIFILIIVR